VEVLVLLLLSSKLQFCASTLQEVQQMQEA
jgi:hypothetical protein